jgi:hypothetical protein
MEMAMADQTLTRPALEALIGQTIRPADYVQREEELSEIWLRIDELHPGVQSGLQQSLRNRLPEGHRAALGKPFGERTFRERKLADQAERWIIVRSGDLFKHFGEVIPGNGGRTSASRDPQLGPRPANVRDRTAPRDV